METSVISARGLTKRFGQRLAVDDLSFEVYRGRVSGFLGPNGAGKTTTLRMMLGLAVPSSGDATLWGRPYGALDHAPTRVGVMLDGASFHPRRSARNHLRWVAAAAEIDSRRIEEVLAAVDLVAAGDRRVGEFSVGMRQRLGIAAALLGEPDLLILDEPANGLDPAGIRWLRQLLRSFAADGGTVFVSSHQLGEVAQIADDVVVVKGGRLVTHTTIEALTGSAGVVWVRSPQRDRLSDLLVAAGAEVQIREADAMQVRGLGAERVGTLAGEAGLVLYELLEQTHSLEDVFFELTGQENGHASVG